MKIIYTKSIMEQIKEARHDAMVANKKIDRIELNVGESKRLNEELNSTGWDCAKRSIGRAFVAGDKVFGINILST